MLPHVYRLSRGEDWRRVHSTGATVHRPGLVVKVLKNKRTVTRFGISVSTKVSKLAVVRNRVKRQIRAAVERHIGHTQSGLDVVIIARTSLAGKPYELIEREVNQGLKKARVLS